MNISAAPALSAGDALILSRDIRRAGSDDSALRRACEAGRLIRVRRGVYIGADEWRASVPDEQYALRVRAAVLTREIPTIVALDSAAVLWGLPRLTAWPPVVHLIPSSPTAPHSRNGIRFHRASPADDERSELNGIAVTSRLRTLVDLARTGTMLDAVAALDCALKAKPSHPHPAETPDALLMQHARTETLRGSARALRAIQFARPEAANPGESYSRVLMHQLGFAPPRLQTEHPNPRGGRYFTDFEWPEHRLIGEFDGKSKYLKPELLGSMTPGEAVVAEKIREDDLRQEGSNFVRWIWDDLHHPARFAALLRSAGVPPARS